MPIERCACACCTICMRNRLTQCSLEKYALSELRRVTSVTGLPISGHWVQIFPTHDTQCVYRKSSAALQTVFIQRAGAAKTTNGRQGCLHVACLLGRGKHKAEYFSIHQCPQYLPSPPPPLPPSPPPPPAAPPPPYCLDPTTWRWRCRGARSLESSGRWNIRGRTKTRWQKLVTIKTSRCPGWGYTGWWTTSAPSTPSSHICLLASRWFFLKIRWMTFKPTILICARTEYL